MDCGRRRRLSLKGHSMSYVLAPIDRLCVTLCRQLVVTFAVSDGFLRLALLFPYATPIPAKIWRCSLRNRSVMLRSADNEEPRLISREILLKYSSLSQYLSVTDRRTDGQTTCHGNAAHCL